MSEAFFKAMDDSRAARQAGFVKALVPFELPEPISFTMYFTRETGAEQIEWSSHVIPEGSSPLACQIVARAKTAKGLPMFDKEDWDKAAQTLMQLDSAFLVHMSNWLEKKIDKVEVDKFEKMLGN